MNIRGAECRWKEGSEPSISIDFRTPSFMRKIWIEGLGYTPLPTSTENLATGVREAEWRAPGQAILLMGI